jgi:glutamine synthetase
MTAAEVLGLIKEKEIKFIDFRFTDTKGKEQHVTVPARVIGEDTFEEGKMFDGSSIAGWKGINESDMVLMPDADSAVVDVFSEEPTLNLRCNVVEPMTMQGYDRCPPMRPISAPRTNSSSSTTCAGTTQCRAPSTRSTRRRVPGTRAAATRT